jgi:isoleucyl-tRNA synthetase
LPGDTESAIPGLRIAIHRADGKKCERCWNYSLQVGKDKEFDTLCERCLPVVRSL